MVLSFDGEEMKNKQTMGMRGEREKVKRNVEVEEYDFNLMIMIVIFHNLQNSSSFPSSRRSRYYY